MRLLPRPRAERLLIETRRLRLLPMSVALLEAEERLPGQWGEDLGAMLPEDWPPELWELRVRAHIRMQLRTRPAIAGWFRYVLRTSTPLPLLVGCVGAFPGPAGDVELGYSVAASQQHQGLASEAVGALTAWLLKQPAVHSVSAQAPLSRPGSVKVMERCGLRFAGEGDEPGTVRYRRWR